MTTIPKIIHLTNSNKEIFSQYKRFYKSIEQHHPSWIVEIYDDNDARNIIVEKFPELLVLYDAYPMNIQRTDIFRVLVVYLYGGFYLDMDILCLKPLDDLCSHQLVISEEKTISVHECEKAGLTHTLRIANYMFGSVPKHRFWLDVVESAIDEFQNEIKSENDILEMTGPGLLTDVYHENKNKYADLTMLWNRDGLCPKKCTKGPSCHFGDYATHYHLGSWRWQSKGRNTNNITTINNSVDPVSKNTIKELLNSRDPRL